jgi:hypothetical protein
MLSACGQAPANTADSAKIIASGDWSRATNLTESIFDIHSSTDTRNDQTTFAISYYNLDAQNSGNLDQVVHLSHLHGTVLLSDNADFVGRIDCNSQCSSGTLTLQNDTEGSRLKGRVRIQFATTSLLSLTKRIRSASSSDGVIDQVAQTMRSHHLLGGTVSQYQINGGWVSPFELNLWYSTTFLGQVPEQVLTFHGTKLLGSVVQLDLNSANGDLNSTLPATIALPGHDSVEICFSGNSNLLGVGAYGPSHPSAPTRLCNSLNP